MSSSGAALDDFKINDKALYYIVNIYLMERKDARGKPSMENLLCDLLIDKLKFAHARYCLYTEEHRRSFELHFLEKDRVCTGADHFHLH